MVFKADPGDDGGGEDQVKKTLVGDSKDDECWTESEEDDC